ncbi:MAG: glycosyltransferase family 9 protein [Magnetospirillum sp.]|nr:glycosyltransferase family 9 protein [Magnetospirillum sp.]
MAGARRSLGVDTMRRVDYWAGVPLCALSTLLLRLVPSRRRAAAPRNVLLIELSEMGSAILADPAMEEMKARGANLHFAIFTQNKASLDLLGTVPEDNIFRIRTDGLGTLLADTLRFLVWSRRKAIDTVIDLELFSRYTALLSGWSGAERVVGFHRFHNEGLYRGEMLTRKVMYNPHIHIARNFFSLVEAAYAAVPDWPPAKMRTPDGELVLKRAEPTPDALARVREKVGRAGWDGRRPLVLVNANASDLLPQRRWPRERFAALIRETLAHRGDALVLLTGAPAERDGLDDLARQVGDPRCVNFAGEIGFKDLVALYHLAVAMVTNDSGPAHFAAVTRMPTIVLFGPETPALYGSLGPSEAVFAGLHCSPCVSAWNHRKTPCADNKCLQAIGVGEVFALLRRHLDAVPAGNCLPPP